jgi:phenylacetate-CoA ligase
VYNEYGASEVGIIAHQCEQGGMHLSAENNIVEILRGGSQAGPGETGEVVVTNLDNYVMPLIRYRIGDVGALRAGTCGCGRGLPLMEVVDGRINNMALLPDGRIISGFYFYYLARDAVDQGSAPHQFVVRQRARDHFHFIIAADAAFDDAAWARLQQRVHEQLGAGLTLTRETAATLPVSAAGKRQQFVCELDVDLAGTQEYGGR